MVGLLVVGRRTGFRTRLVDAAGKGEAQSRCADGHHDAGQDHGVGDGIGRLQSFPRRSGDQEKKNTRSHHVESEYFADGVPAGDETQQPHGEEQ
jgi:hypothetical protein